MTAEWRKRKSDWRRHFFKEKMSLEEAHHHRRPWIIAWRQRVAVTADHVDEPVLPDPNVQDDPVEAPAAVEDIPADAGAEAAED